MSMELLRLGLQFFAGETKKEEEDEVIVPGVNGTGSGTVSGAVGFTPAPAPEAPTLEGYMSSNNRYDKSGYLGANNFFDTEKKWRDYYGYDPDRDYQNTVNTLNYEYQTAMATYGENAEKMYQMGLQNSGVSDIFQANAFSAYLGNMNKAASDRINANNQLKREYGKYTDAMNKGWLEYDAQTQSGFQTESKNFQTERDNKINTATAAAVSKYNGYNLEDVLTELGVAGYDQGIIDAVRGRLSVLNHESLQAQTVQQLVQSIMTFMPNFTGSDADKQYIKDAFGASVDANALDQAMNLATTQYNNSEAGQNKMINDTFELVYPNFDPKKDKETYISELLAGNKNLSRESAEKIYNMMRSDYDTNIAAATQRAEALYSGTQSGGKNYVDGVIQQLIDEGFSESVARNAAATLLDDDPNVYADRRAQEAYDTAIQNMGIETIDFNQYSSAEAFMKAVASQLQGRGLNNWVVDRAKALAEKDWKEARADMINSGVQYVIDNIESLDEEKVKSELARKMPEDMAKEVWQQYLETPSGQSRSEGQTDKQVQGYIDEYYGSYDGNIEHLNLDGIEDEEMRERVKKGIEQRFTSTVAEIYNIIKANYTPENADALRLDIKNTYPDKYTDAEINAAFTQAADRYANSSEGIKAKTDEYFATHGASFNPNYEGGMDAFIQNVMGVDTTDKNSADYKAAKAAWEQMKTDYDSNIDKATERAEALYSGTQSGGKNYVDGVIQQLIDEGFSESVARNAAATLLDDDPNVYADRRAQEAYDTAIQNMGIETIDFKQYSSADAFMNAVASQLQGRGLNNWVVNRAKALAEKNWNEAKASVIAGGVDTVMKYIDEYDETYVKSQLLNAMPQDMVDEVWTQFLTTTKGKQWQQSQTQETTAVNVSAIISSFGENGVDFDPSKYGNDKQTFVNAMTKDGKYTAEDAGQAWEQMSADYKAKQPERVQGYVNELYGAYQGYSNTDWNKYLANVPEGDREAVKQAILEQWKSDVGNARTAILNYINKLGLDYEGTEKQKADIKQQLGLDFNNHAIDYVLKSIDSTLGVYKEGYENSPEGIQASVDELVNSYGAQFDPNYSYIGLDPNDNQIKIGGDGGIGSMNAFIDNVMGIVTNPKHLGFDQAAYDNAVKAWEQMNGQFKDDLEDIMKYDPAQYGLSESSSDDEIKKFIKLCGIDNPSAAHIAAVKSKLGDFKSFEESTENNLVFNRIDEIVNTEDIREVSLEEMYGLLGKGRSESVEISEDKGGGTFTDYIDDTRLKKHAATMLTKAINNMSDLQSAWNLIGYDQLAWEELNDGEKILKILDAAGRYKKKGLLEQDALNKIYEDWITTEYKNILSIEGDDQRFKMAKELEAQLLTFIDFGYIDRQAVEDIISKIPKN